MVPTYNLGKPGRRSRDHRLCTCGSAAGLRARSGGHRRGTERGPAVSVSPSGPPSPASARRAGPGPGATVERVLPGAGRVGRRAGRPRRGQTEDVLDALYDLGETVPVKTTEAHRR